MKKLGIIVLSLFFSTFVFAQSSVLPNKAKTPGEIRGDSLETICHSGYTKIVRNVSTTRKQMVYNDYLIAPIYRKFYVIDHLIPLGLGGSNSRLNLWAQDKRTKFYNDVRKNTVGNYLRKQVCSGKINLEQAQNEMAVDWTKAYDKYILKNGK